MRFDGLHVDALVEHPLTTAPHFDAGAGGVFHMTQALGDIARLRVSVRAADEEVVGQTVQGDPEVRLPAGVIVRISDPPSAGARLLLAAGPIRRRSQRLARVVGNGNSGTIRRGA